MIETKEISQEEAKLIKQQFTSVLFDLSFYIKIPITYLGFYEKDKLIGMCFFEKTTRLKGVSTLANPVFTPHNNLTIQKDLTQQVQKEVLLALTRYLKSKRIGIFQFSLPPSLMEFKALKDAGFNLSVKYTYQIDLKKTTEKIFDNFSPERKKNIKNAQKKGIIIKSNKPDAFVLIEHTINKNNLKSLDVVKQLIFEFCNENNSIIKTAYFEEKPIAAVLCVHDSSKCYYLYGGYSNQNKHEGAGAWCMFEAIKEAKEKSVEIFDFEGSMIPEIERYFRNFGGTLTPYHQITKAKFPWKIILNLRNKEYF